MFLGNETTCPNGHQGNFIYNPNAAGSAPILTCAICGRVINVQTNQVVQFPGVMTGGHVPQTTPTWGDVINSNNEIAREVLEEARDKLQANRDAFKGVNPPAHYYETGYREGMDTAIRIIGDMIDARQKHYGVSKG